MSAVKLLPWDTKYFGMRIARYQPSRLDDRSARTAIDFCKKKKVRCLYYLAELGDARSVAAAERHGFGLADVRITLAMQIGAERAPRKVRPTAGLQIRDYVSKDGPHLRRIAKKGFRHSRFFFDRNFPRDKSRELYAEWIGKAGRGFADRVFVAHVGGRAAGFIACDLESKARKGRFPLVGVDPALSGRGIGSALVEHALGWFETHKARRVEVVTQARNYRAQALYERCGFTVSNASVWYHKWFSNV